MTQEKSQALPPQDKPIEKPLSLEQTKSAPVKTKKEASDLPPIGGGSNGFPAIGGGFGGGLGSIGGRAGGFVYDQEAKKRAAAELAKLNADFDAGLPDEEEKQEGKSLQDLMREKREKTQKYLDSEKSKQETVQERQERLKA